MQVQARVRQLVGDAGQRPGVVLQQHAGQLGLLEADVGLLQAGPGRLHVVGDDADQPLVPERHGRDRFEVMMKA